VRFGWHNNLPGQMHDHTWGHISTSIGKSPIELEDVRIGKQRSWSNIIWLGAADRTVIGHKILRAIWQNREPFTNEAKTALTASDDRKLKLAYESSHFGSTFEKWPRARESHFRQCRIVQSQVYLLVESGRIQNPVWMLPVKPEGERPLLSETMIRGPYSIGRDAHLDRAITAQINYVQRPDDR
jgi:hypothetical protein